MKEADKLRALFDLRVRIINELFVEQRKDVWFFPERDGVQGWQGAQDMIFVSLNPSYRGGSSSKAFNSFYQELRLNGFTSAHLTDIVKVRARGKEIAQVLADAGLMAKQKLYLLEEIDITRPRLIVPMGKRTTQFLRDFLPGDAGIRPIPHYAPRAPTQENRRKFSLAVREVSEEYRRHA